MVAEVFADAAKAILHKLCPAFLTLLPHVTIFCTAFLVSSLHFSRSVGAAASRDISLPAAHRVVGLAPLSWETSLFPSQFH
jgi:hypothetical protein